MTTWQDIARSLAGGSKSPSRSAGLVELAGMDRGRAWAKARGFDIAPAVAEANDILGAWGGRVLNIGGEVVEVTLQLDAEIVDFPVTPRSTIEAAVRVHVIINGCRGGSLPAAAAILEMLTRKKASCRICGDVASAAAILGSCLPGNRSMHPEATLTFHSPARLLYADAGSLRQAADELDGLTALITRLLSERTRQPAPVISEWMQPGRDVVFDADACLHLNLVDTITA